MLGLFSRSRTSALPSLCFHNTLSGEKEAFSPLNGEVRMYNCGPTVYDTQHIGNLRAAVFADTLRRALRYWGFPLKQVINITDVGHLSSDADEGEDKMAAGLKREGMPLTLEGMALLGERYAKEYFEDIAALGVPLEEIKFPRASGYIAEQIALVRSLEEKGYAYRAESGVYFDVARFPSYGKLGGINLSGLKAGARVKESPDKRGPYDFLLWKPEKTLGWDSPWGKGFPGWHTECVAMAFSLLGKQIDIHTGGIEHIPVHHNNELAQAESLTGKRFVKYWLHNDHITIEGRKISKSLGNTVYLSGVRDRGFSPRALRYWFLTAHYRSPANFTWEALQGANTARERLLRIFFEELKDAAGGEPDKAFVRDLSAAIADDLDTPKAIALTWDLIKNEKVSPAAKRASLLEADRVLGLGLSDKRELSKLSVLAEKDIPEEVQVLLAAREEARAAKDFAHADDYRRQIQELGFEIKDTSEGAQVIKK